jgi:hypothetical protein
VKTRLSIGLMAVAAVAAAFLAAHGPAVRAQAVASIALPAPGSTEQLYAGCNNISLTFPDGTSPQTVVQAVTPAGAVDTLWRFNGPLNKFEGFSPAYPQASDLQTVNFLDAVWLCMTAVPETTSPPLPSPTPALSCVSGSTTYHNEQFGFEFQYCSECTLTERSEGAPGPGGGEVYLSIIVGSRLEVHVSDSGGLSLADYVNRVADQLKAGGDSVEPISQGSPVGGAESMTVRYRFGGLNRYGEATFFQHDGSVYDVGFDAGAFTCNEPQVYTGILSTFRFAE